MQIEFLYFEDCPSHGTALARLRGVLDDAGVKDSITILQVETEKQAIEHRFSGSPTIRINGVDIDPQPDDTPYLLACRIYKLEDGRISPLPSVGMIEWALVAARSTETG